MASDSDDFDKKIENLKDSLKKTFTRVYASLKARELKSLRQLDALRKQCQDNEDLRRNCVQNIQISYENESTLIDNINRYGTIDLERLNFDSSMFTLEDYISPNDDHLYSYKCIGDFEQEDHDITAIQEAALKEITKTGDCVCFVTVRTEDVSKRFRDDTDPVPVTHSVGSSTESCEDSTAIVSSKDSQSNIELICEDDKSEPPDVDEIKKIEPTDEWLNEIKTQTETEPSQVTDVMEHSTITCS